MANHLVLEKALLERGQDGSLMLFSNGNSLCLLQNEMLLVSNWLSQLQGKKPLHLSNALFECDSQGNLRISARSMRLYLNAREVIRVKRWLNQGP